MENNKITVQDYLNNKDLLEATYIPFEEKLTIVSNAIRSSVEALGGLNTTMLRRVTTEIFIDAITNLDLVTVDDNGLSGYDQLCYKDELYPLINRLGNEYEEFQKILDERIDDYIRTETNPAITINAIYAQVTEMFGNIVEILSQQIQNINVEQLLSSITDVTEQIKNASSEGGETDEG